MRSQTRKNIQLPNTFLPSHINADTGLISIARVCTNFDSGKMHGWLWKSNLRYANSGTLVNSVRDFNHSTKPGSTLSLKAFANFLYQAFLSCDHDHHDQSLCVQLKVSSIVTKKDRRVFRCRAFPGQLLHVATLQNFISGSWDKKYESHFTY